MKGPLVKEEGLNKQRVPGYGEGTDYQRYRYIGEVNITYGH